MKTVRISTAVFSEGSPISSIGRMVRPQHRQHVEQTAHRRDDEAARLRQREAGGHHQQDVERDEDRLGTAALGHDRR